MSSSSSQEFKRIDHNDIDDGIVLNLTQKMINGEYISDEYYDVLDDLLRSMMGDEAFDNMNNSFQKSQHM
jgi:hypothetical protein